MIFIFGFTVYEGTALYTATWLLSTLVKPYTEYITNTHTHTEVVYNTQLPNLAYPYNNH